MKALENLLKKYENDLATFTDLLDSCNPNNRLKIEKLRYKVNCHKNMVNDLLSVLAEVASTESKLNLADVNSSALTKLEAKLLLPLIEKRRLEIDDYTVEFHELGHTIEKLKAIIES